jgi:manganese transport protein
VTAPALVRHRARWIAPLLGPAFVACIAYVDPGNFATNVQGGAEHGYLLLWVIVAANAMATLIQYLSSKLGIATGRSLPELCRDRLPGPIVRGLWVQAEVIAIATDVAEFVGAAIALDLLFGVPPFPAGVITAAVSFAVLGLETRGRRRFEGAMMFFLGVITLGFLYDTLRIGFDAAVATSGLVPRSTAAAACCWPPASSARR